MGLICCLLWKNLSIYKKQLLVILVIFLTPIIMGLLLLLARLSLSTYNDPERHFKPISIDKMPDKIPQNPNKVLHFTPDDASLSELMDVVMSDLSFKAIKPHKNAQELENALLESNDFAGVQFSTKSNNFTQMPKTIKISIRMPAKLRSNTSQIWLTTELFPPDMEVGARNPTEMHDGVPSGYYMEGFLALQFRLTNAFMMMQIPPVSVDPKIEMLRFPYPEVTHDYMDNFLSDWLVLFVVIAYLPACCYLVWHICLEKRLQIKQYLGLLGYENKRHWFAWFLIALVTFFIVTSILTLLLLLPVSSDGATLDESSGVIIFFVLILYSVQTIWFCFTFGVILNNHLRTTIIFAVVHVMLVFPVDESSNNFLDTVLILLVPQLALKLCLYHITLAELSNEGTRFEDAFHPTSANTMPLGIIMIYMLVSAVLYTFLCLYLERRAHNIDRKSVDKDVFVAEKIGQMPHAPAKVVPQQPSQSVHLPEFTFPPGIRLNNISVKIDNFYLLKDFFLNAYPDEVTVLWGARNSGKTTVLKVLVGTMIPTRGKAQILGKDIVFERKEALRDVGLCLEGNHFFQNLTAAEHIRFYCRLRGLTGEDVDEEVRKYLAVIGLQENDASRVAYLSHAQRRIFAVCCAFCGKSKVVVLDQPTTGLHLLNKYIVWDLIKEEKQGRTILILTENMDEAEVIGDRVATIHYGRLQSYGTPFFLKTLYPRGYQLIIVKSVDWDIDHVTPMLQAHSSSISIESDIDNEITYRIPDTNRRDMENILRDVETKQDELHIQSFRLNLMKMEEIILSEKNVSTRDVEEEQFQVEEPHKIKLKRGSGQIIFDGGMKFWKSQCHAMLLKKFLYTWHHGRLSVLQFFLPFALIVASMYLSPDGVSCMPPLTIGVNEYNQVYAVKALTEDFIKSQTDDDASLIKHYESYITEKKKHGHITNMYLENAQQFDRKWLNMSHDYTQGFIDTRFVAGILLDKNKKTALLNNQPLHTPPFTVNTLLNAIGDVYYGSKFSIQFVNAPLPFPPEYALLNASRESNLNRNNQYIELVAILMAIISSCYICFPINERVKGLKQMQFLAGVNIFIFWLLHLFWDMVTYSFTVLSITAVTGYLEMEGLYGPAQSRDIFLLLFLFGPCMLTFTYLISFLPNNAKLGFCTYCVFQFLYIWAFPSIEDSTFISHLARLFPIISLQYALNDYHIYQRLKIACDAPRLRNLEKDKLCEKEPACCEVNSLLGFIPDTVLNDILFMILFFVIFFLILILLHYIVCKNIPNALSKRWIEMPEPTKHVDDHPDVKAEKLRTKNIPYTDFVNCSVLLDNVSKFYFKADYLSLNEISFRVHGRECFALLGPQGSGKTTVLNCISGLSMPTEGKVYVKTIGVRPYANSICNEIGYCPQENLLFLDYTGRENLIIVGLLRGIQWCYAKMWAKKIAKILGFYHKLGWKTSRYSVADKRRLCLAIAITGKQSLLLLDEPTEGLDPDNRREIWQVIESLIDSGYCVVLSTKNMEECIKLSSKMAVIINGNLRYIGQHKVLRSKACDTLRVKIKVVFNPNAPIHKDKKHAAEALQDRCRIIKTFLKKTFMEFKVIEEYGALMVVHIKTDSVKLSEVFEVMYSHRVELGIEEFTVSLETFEEKFNRMSETQRDRQEVE